MKQVGFLTSFYTPLFLRLINEVPLFLPLPFRSLLSLFPYTSGIEKSESHFSLLQCKLSRVSNLLRCTFADIGGLLPRAQTAIFF
jgi:hypothetical protein